MRFPNQGLATGPDSFCKLGLVQPRFAALLMLTALAGVAPAGTSGPDLKPLAADVKQQLERDVNHLLALYKHLHAHPELAFEEVETAARLARELKEAGLEVATGIGKTGIVGLLRNGKGPVVMVRADMDGLPIIEQTGLPYASKVRVRNKDGLEVGVMHSCGHDVNMTCLVGTVRVLARLKDRWSGTLMAVCQPAEEIGKGARAMLADGLFTKFPRPNYALGLHCDGRIPHGHVNYREGLMQAHVDSLDITVRGKGGHGAAPHVTIDPVVLSARIILDLQTIVSREVNPQYPAVVTVGSIHGGTKHNIIPNEVKLQLTVRTTRDDVRKQVIEAIVRLVKAAAQGARAPEPIIQHQMDDFTPALVSDEALTRKTVAVFRQVLGPERVHERPMSMGGEDFSEYVRAGVPGCYWFVGTAPPELVEEAKKGGRPLSLGHTDAYYPIPEPTIRTGVTTMSLAVLNLMGK